MTTKKIIKEMESLSAKNKKEGLSPSEQMHLNDLTNQLAFHIYREYEKLQKISKRQDRKIKEIMDQMDLTDEKIEEMEFFNDMASFFIEQMGLEEKFESFVADHIIQLTEPKHIN